VNKRLFIFLCCSTLHLVSFQISTTLHPRRKGQKYLTEDEISAELLADTLSDVREDADSDSENDSDSSIIGNRQNKIVHPLPSYSDSEQCANEVDDDDKTLYSAVSTWVKTDKTPNLGPFTGVKQILSDPTKVSQVQDSFLETHSLICCVRKLIYITYKIRKSMLLVLRGSNGQMSLQQK